MTQVLRQCESRLRKLIDGLGPNMFVGLMTPDGVLIEANQAALAAAALKPEDVLGKAFEQTYWWAYSGEVQQQLRAAIRQAAAGVSSRYDVQVRVRDDELIWLDFSMHPLLDETGRVEFLIPSAIVIGERKRTEEALMASEARMRNLFEQASDGIYLISADNRYLDANVRGLELLGYARDELLQMNVADVLAPHETARLSVEPPRMMAGMSHYTEWVYLRKDGTTFPGEVSARRLDEHSYLAIVRDLTPRRRADAALSEGEERLRLAVQAANVGLWDWTLKTDAVVYSREWKSQLGYAEHEISNNFEEWRSRVHADDLTATLVAVRAARENPAGRYEVEFRMRHKDGTWRWILSKGEVLRNAAGEPVRMIGSHMDITAQKVAERRRHQYAVQLRGLMGHVADLQETERRQLSRELHDQIGQYLTALNINLDIIRSRLTRPALDSVSERIEDCAQLVEVAMQAMDSLISGLRPPMLDDGGLLVALKWHASEFQKRTGIVTLVAANGPVLGISATVRLMLFRIAQEALANVSKHACARSVCITLRVEDEKTSLDISDDGVGFDPKTVPADPARNHWGLLFMRERAQAAGGVLHIDSAPGRGSNVGVEVQGCK